MNRIKALSITAALLAAFACQPPATETADTDTGAREAQTESTRGAVTTGGRDQIRIVGSSTVYPFSTKVAEQFGNKTDYKTPVVESTGSGGGLKLFCAGVGLDHADITNASRAIKESEIERCRENGVEEITEVNIGYDGIVVASKKGGTDFELTREELYLALAREVPNGEGELVKNPHSSWTDIDTDLPDIEIEVYGPPPTSGTRDAFVELVMEAGCQEFDWIAELEETDEDRFEQICHSMREDGAFIQAGENDNLIVQKLGANSNALGIFGFSFLDQNRDKIDGATIDGVAPTFENIADEKYPVSRPLFFYVKKAHVGVVPGIQAYVDEFVSPAAVGEGGYLTQIGLIPLPDEKLAEVRQAARELESNVGVTSSSE